jgi:hypothetical protein
MTDISTSQPPPGGTQESTSPSMTEQARTAAQSAAHGGSDVLDSAKEQGRQVVVETGRQARDLYGQVRSQVSDQANTQQKRAVGSLYALGDEINRMAEQGGQSGPATEIARQAGDKINQAAQWLEGKEPGHVLDEVKSFARRNPGAFLVGAAVLGVLAGRLSKNLIPESDDESGSGTTRYTGSTGYTGTSGYTATGTAPLTEPAGTGYAATTATGYAEVPPVGQPYGGATGTSSTYGAGS